MPFQAGFFVSVFLMGIVTPLSVPIRKTDRRRIMKFEYKRIIIDEYTNLSIDGESISADNYTDIINDGWRVVDQNWLCIPGLILIEKELL